MNCIRSVWLFPVSLQVPRGSGSFRVEKPSDVEIEHVATHYYLRGLCSQRALYASPNPGLSLSAVSSNLPRTHPLKNETISHHGCETLLGHSSLCNFSIDSFAFRKDHHLLLQVKLCGKDFQRDASGPKLHWLQLLRQVLQGRRQCAAASGGNC